eukprot:15470567-Alexandrium_andersonii.AAC.1
MTWPGVLWPAVPQWHGRPMHSSSSNCAAARDPRPARAPASRVVCVQALAASSMTWTAITLAVSRLA